MMDLQVARDLFTVAYDGVISKRDFLAAYNNGEPMYEVIRTLCAAQQFMWATPRTDAHNRVLVPEGMYLPREDGGPEPAPMGETCSGKQAPK